MDLNTLVTIFTGLGIFIVVAVTLQWISTYRYNKAYEKTNRQVEFMGHSSTLIYQAAQRNERYSAEYKAKRKGH
jgi:hypothetical protein